MIKYNKTQNKSMGILLKTHSFLKFLQLEEMGKKAQCHYLCATEKLNVLFPQDHLYRIFSISVDLTWHKRTSELNVILSDILLLMSLRFQILI